MLLARTAIILLLSSIWLLAQFGVQSPRYLGSLNSPQIVPNPYPTPTIYVSRNAAGNGLGTSWANAKTNIAQAIWKTNYNGTPNCIEGSVISIDGGTSGLRYTNDVTITNGITIYGSPEAGHNGQVTWEGAKTFAASNGPAINVRNLEFVSSTARYHVTINPFTQNILFEDVKITRSINTSGSSGLAVNIGGGISSVWKRCYFANSENNALYNARCIGFSALGRTEFYDCVFGLFSGIIAGTSASTNVFVNCTAIYPNAVDNWIQIGTAAENQVFLTNCFIVSGQGPCTDGASSVGAAINCYWGYDTISATATNFDSAGVITKTANTRLESLNDSLSDWFTVNTNTSMGEVFVRIDDLFNMDSATNTARVLNPEIKVHGVADCGQLKRPTSAQIGEMRWLIENGNIIGSHGASHSYYNNSNVLQISATGTSPKCSIAGSRSGDSTNWTGTMSIAIGTDGVDRATNSIDLASSSYDEIGEVAAYWQSGAGHTVGDGTVTCTRQTANHNEYERSLVLADVSELDISSAKYLTFSNLAFARSEITEAILDLESYIKFGTDRAGGAVAGAGAAGAGTLSSNYVCRVFSAPGNQSDSTMSNEIVTANPNLIAAWSVAGSSSSYSDQRHPFMGVTSAITSLNIFGVRSGDGANASSLMESSLGPRLNTTYYHGRAYIGTDDDAGTTNLKNALLKFNLGRRTFPDYFAWIRTNSDFASNNPAQFLFTNNSPEGLSRYFYKGNFVPTRRSLLNNTGSSLGETSDIRGYKVPRNGGTDIGAYERQQE